MAEATLPPGAVFRSESEEEQGGWPPLIGSPPQWADEDDETYAVISNDTTLGVHGALAYLDPFAFSGTPATVAFHVRASTTSPDPTAIGSLLVSDDSGVVIVISGWALATTTPTWYVSDPVAIPDPSAFVTASAAGTIRLGVSQDAYTTGVTDTRTTIHEAHVVITYEPTTTIPACRLYPRDDGRGISNSARIYPPSKATRIFGGYQ